MLPQSSKNLIEIYLPQLWHFATLLNDLHSVSFLTARPNSDGEVHQMIEGTGWEKLIGNKYHRWHCQQLGIWLLYAQLCMRLCQLIKCTPCWNFSEIMATNVTFQVEVVKHKHLIREKFSSLQYTRCNFSASVLSVGFGNDILCLPFLAHSDHNPQEKVWTAFYPSCSKIASECDFYPNSTPNLR